MTRTNLFSVLYLCRTFSPSSSFSPRFHSCSFFYLFSHLASLISSYVQYDDGAHKAERSSNASELRALRQAIQGMTTKLLLFSKLRTVWFSCVVVLRLVPVLAGKDPVKVGCSGVGALARFQIFPWIHLDTMHARPNGVMLIKHEIIRIEYYREHTHCCVFSSFGRVRRHLHLI